MSSKRAERLQKSQIEEVPKPEIKSVRVLNKKEDEIDVTKYGKEILIEVKTENAFSCKLVITAKNSDWKEPEKKIEKEWAVQLSASPIVAEGKNFIPFTPEEEWLKDAKEQSAKTVFEVSLLASARYAFYIGGDKLQEVDKKESKEIEIWDGYISPIRNPRITSPFNLKRIHPVKKVVRPHRGTDMVPRDGDNDIIAPYNGKITDVKSKNDGDGGGNRVYMIDDRGYAHRFMHLKDNSIVVKANDKIKKGSKIAVMGNTGIGTGAHLHYEILKNGTHLNPVTINDDIKR